MNEMEHLILFFFFLSFKIYVLYIEYMTMMYLVIFHHFQINLYAFTVSKSFHFHASKSFR